MVDGPLAVILAAGQGTRMRSTLPKVLHQLGGRPLLLHALDVARAISDEVPIVIVNPAHAEVARLAEQAGAAAAPQQSPRGTGDAVRSVPPPRRVDGPVLVLSADVPLLRPATVEAMLLHHARTGAACTLLTTVPADPRGLGRIVRDEHGRVARIVEERDLLRGARPPAECNAGVYVFEGARLWGALERLGTDNAQGEVYLTDVVVQLAGEVEALAAADPEEALGINDRRQLAAAEAVLRRRTLDALMLAGVTIEDPVTTYVDPTVRIGADTVLQPMTVLRGATRLGGGCEIGPMAQLRDVVAGDGVRIGASHLEECRLGDRVVVGQFNRVRPGSELAEGVELGTHAEVKNSVIGAGSRVGHFSCVLDSDLGERVNIGAGTVTCNYDGSVKHRTVIGGGTFVGSDSILVAPLRIGEGAYIGAGSVITHDVPAGALALERAEQRTIEEWARRRRRGTAAAAARGNEDGRLGEAR